MYYNLAWLHTAQQVLAWLRIIPHDYAPARTCSQVLRWNSTKNNNANFVARMQLASSYRAVINHWVGGLRWYHTDLDGITFSTFLFFKNVDEIPLFLEKKWEKKKNQQILANFVKVRPFLFIFVYNSRTTMCEFRTTTCEFCTSTFVILF